MSNQNILSEGMFALVGFYLQIHSITTMYFSENEGPISVLQTCRHSFDMYFFKWTA